jgi:hypothetical protein
MNTKLRKRGRSDSVPAKLIPAIDIVTPTSSRSLDLPDLIKASLEFVPHGKLFQARLVSRKWAGAVADCVECFLCGQGGASEW